MAKVVGLHTQALDPSAGIVALQLMAKVIRAARLRDSFPSASRVRDLLIALEHGLELERYGEYLFDARTGIPNLASVTRVATDVEIIESGGLSSDAAAREYAQRLRRLRPIPVDEIETAIRRFDPREGRVEIRVRVTKLDGSGRFTRISVDLSSTQARWIRPVLRLDDEGVRVAVTEQVQTMIYRHAAFDAEMLFVRLAELEGVEVQRVERGMIGPLLFAVPGPAGLETLAEPSGDALADGWRRVLESQGLERAVTLGAFQTDIAAIDIKTEKSNDPLAPLLHDRLGDSAAQAHAVSRETSAFKVYRDCKFVASREMRVVPESLMQAAGTRNLIYELR